MGAVERSCESQRGPAVVDDDLLVPVDSPRIRALAIVAARGKRRSGDVARFMLDVDRHVGALWRALVCGEYRPSVGRCFRIEDPKPRWIYALPFRDRVAQHLLIAQTLAAVERGMAPQSYACRVGRGTHRCLRRAVELSRQRRFVLRVDVQKFFASIDHAILRRQLDRTTPREWRWLRDRFIDAELPRGRWSRWRSTSGGTSCSRRGRGRMGCRSGRSRRRSLGV